MTETKDTPRWLSATVLGVAGLFYAYAVWNAIAQLSTLARDGLSGTGWATMLFAVLFPVLVFVLAFGFGRRRGGAEQALILLAGLGIVAAFSLSLVGYTVLNWDVLVTG
ncbi:hypothetical protein [Microbacterium sp. NPDC058345]|uniref:hypothetical protein n=1 Tax=Microbacterium sp. NPDC058345 TaxID=3346455 RepID=UPI003657B33C